VNVEIICIGSELLKPNAVETNSLFLTKELNNLGFRVNIKSIVEDKAKTLTKLLTDSCERSALIIATGGLGPTVDDVTIRVVSKVLARKMVLNETVLNKIIEKFSYRGLEMPLNNRKQALIPLGAKVLENKLGTAPGLWLKENTRQFFFLPGVPSEMKQIFKDHIAPILRNIAKGRIFKTKIFKLAGLTESEVDWRIKDLTKKYQNEITILAYPGQIEIAFQVEARNHKEADSKINNFAQQLRKEFGNDIFGFDDDSLEAAVGNMLKQKKATLAIAESCTGGLISSRITNVPGSSEYFERGVVVYSNQAKIELLGIKPELIESYGAVSEEVAEAMAQGVKKKSSTDYGLSVTGIAGPTGGSENKPVGLVYIGLAEKNKVTVSKNIFSGNRDRIKFYSSQAALDLLRRQMLRS
jgi:nicotinamide-nucleotide amidase